MDLYHRTYGTGKPLLILHGLLGSNGNWHTLSRKIFAQHFAVHALDLRNHGMSPHAESMSYEEMATDIGNFLDQHGLENVNILGHSMGGKVALECAQRFPERLHKIVVVDITPFGYPDGHTGIINALLNIDLGEKTSRHEVDDELSQSIPEIGVRQFLLKNLKRTSEGFEWRPNLEGILNDYDEVRDSVKLGRCLLPILFVRGSESNYIGENDIPRIREYFPNAQFADIEGAGHWVHADQPESLATHVIDFLQPNDAVIADG